MPNILKTPFFYRVTKQRRHLLHPKKTQTAGQGLAKANFCAAGRGLAGAGAFALQQIFWAEGTGSACPVGQGQLSCKPCSYSPLDPKCLL